MVIFSDHKSSPTRGWAFCAHRAILFAPGHAQLEPMVKIVQWDFSLNINRAPRVQFPCLHLNKNGINQRKIIPLKEFASQNFQIDVHDRE